MDCGDVGLAMEGSGMLQWTARDGLLAMQWMAHDGRLDDGLLVMDSCVIL